MVTRNLRTDGHVVRLTLLTNQAKALTLLLATLAFGLAACGQDEVVGGPEYTADTSPNNPDSQICPDGNCLPDPCTVTGAESCDGLDNDCNGLTDDGLCDDGNPCSIDRCDLAGLPGACTSTLVLDGPCDDGSKCTSGEKCIQGVCTPEQSIDCDDGNPCTADVCDPVTLACDHTATSGPCEDGSACTTNDICAEGLCAPGTALNCDDGNPCTSDVCDPAVGCAPIPGGGACDDQNPCTEKDTCADGACTGGTVKVCDDGNPCTTDQCDAATGKCATEGSQLSGQPCSVPDNVCATSGLCKDGACTPDAQMGCDDANPCTADTCDAVKGCQHAPASGAACDDGSPCTQDDICAQGVCKAGPNTCQCATDADCASAAAGNKCLGVFLCDKSQAAYVCVVKPGTAVVCDGSPTECGVPACIPDTGTCGLEAVNEGKPCDADGSVCTSGDACKFGKCVAGTLAKCDDANPCTDDTCSPKVGCAFAANTAPCEADGNGCTSGDTCKGGICLVGSLANCDDKNACTLDACDPGTGSCKHEFGTTDGKPCDADGSICTVGDFCKAGKCETGPQPECNDYNVCTDDKCDPLTGCQYLARLGDCNTDANLCTLDTCVNKACVKGAAKTCEDGNPCTADGCTPSTGECTFDGAAEDGKDCATGGDKCVTGATCDQGKCLGGTTVDCDDDNSCTADTCDLVTGLCVHKNEPDASNCDDGNPCTSPDRCDHDGHCLGDMAVCNDDNPCTLDQCQKTNGACQFEPNLGDPCEDGSNCTIGDSCMDGSCRPGPKKACEDGNPCTSDLCDEASGECGFNAADGSCDDGDKCTQADKCADGKCKSGVPIPCDDGNSCTNDSCDPKTGQCLATAVFDGLECADAQPCTQGDMCKAGKCIAGVAVTCNDGNPCTADVCDSKTGKCTFQPQSNKACDDGNGCTVGDICVVGKCTSGTSTCQCETTADCAPLEDGNLCNGTLYCNVTTNSCKLDLKTVIVCDESQNTTCATWKCSPSAGKCVPTNAPTSTPCDADKSLCTVGDHCLAGICQPGALNPCDDSNPCTNDSCSAALGCQHTANQLTCSDDNPCTVGDLCVQAKCIGGPTKLCFDGADCTFDFCDSKTGNCAVSPLSGGACTDGNQCTQGDQCKVGKCEPGPTKPCDDGKACTSDECDVLTGNCAYKPLPTGQQCSDSNPCTQNDTCKDGACLSGPVLVCGDGNACTKDACNVATGECIFPALPLGTACSDGNACTLSDFCSNGACTPGAPKVCQAGQICALAECDALTGACLIKQNGTPCDDGNGCSNGDACQNGVCAPTSWQSCNDGNACTSDTCDSKTGKCVFTANTFSCSDGNYCTGGDRCTSGTCTGQYAVNCSDGNGCTADTCAPASGCGHSNLNAVPCDDGSVCSINDTCVNGSCKGQGIVCNDGNQCTIDSCDPATGCKYVPHNLGCSDGNACTLNDKCTAGKCVPGAQLVCNDTNECTSDSCRPQDGQCVFTNTDGSACVDANLCTLNDKCKAGECVSSNQWADCDDGNQCTSDMCIPAEGCVNVQNPAAPCDDGNACTLNDVCLGGKCVSGSPGICDDNNACTTDVCDPTVGCLHTNTTANCDDGDACKGPDLCAAGKCVATGAIVCDDNNPCTTDGCDTKTGCTKVALANNTKCDDKNPCTANDLCTSGFCAGTGGPQCNDNDPCTTDSCSTSTGCTHTPIDNIACDDGNACTAAEVCKNGKCADPNGSTCDDGNACSKDVCDTVKGCQHTAISTGKSVDITVVSDSKTTFKDGSAQKAAVPTWDQLAGWTHAISGATWLWNAATVATPQAVTQVVFTRSFDVPVGGEKTIGTLMIATDGSFVCTLNGMLVGVDIDEANYGSPVALSLTGQLKEGPNTFVCTVTNPGKAGATAYTNPAGLYYRMDITWFEIGGAVPCEDGNACTTGDWCKELTCKAGAVTPCDDANNCTADLCDPKSGCSHVPNTAIECDDGNSCTVQDACSAGKCAGKTPAECDDFNACTVESCDPKTGCVHTSDEGKACNDNDACTAKDACKAGKCVGASGTDCDDGNPCSTDGCASLTGCFHSSNSGAACDDGNLCTLTDSCAGSLCIGKTPANCDDSNPCTGDSCSATAGCVHTALTGPVCQDGNACTLSDACQDGVCAPGTNKVCTDGEPCTTDGCDVKTGLCAFEAIDGGQCEDGNLCTVLDTCKTGKCTAGTTRSCADGKPCTLDVCNPMTGDCANPPAQGGYACEDGSGCTTGDACVNGECVGKAKSCDDTNPCTVDGCDPATALCNHVAASDGTVCGSNGICVKGVCK
jgi:hypothetical protein